eukprot:CAMPEP_0119409476 /NCGR_PEP_ID=MMETSP1335-20130426/2759_1 /TAXON_ID=259385 /ORGANISM="Chrysoculter rhomboideus, Strain RCC1486" /LENGTH=34 /DNA_ID= /DNA_START= /DNA_END= /DNA_ORIENTATION=
MTQLSSPAAESKFAISPCYGGVHAAAAAAPPSIA